MERHHGDGHSQSRCSPSSQELHEPRDPHDPFATLPVEVLLNLAFHLPSLSSIHCFDGASLAFAATFNQFGAEIVESTMARELIQPSRQMIRLVVFLQTMLTDSSINSEPLTLDAFLDQEFLSRPNSAACRPIPPDTSPSVLRSMLATATKISSLAESCLADFMRRCLAQRPSHLVNKTMPGVSQLWHLKSIWHEFPGQAYQPHSSGPPSWLERQRAMRAFWSLQLYLAISKALFKHCIVWADDTFGWEGLKIDNLVGYTLKAEVSSKLGPVCGNHFMVANAQAIGTVVEYLRDMGWNLPICRKDDLLALGMQSLCLPSPTLHARKFQWDHEAIGKFPGCEDEFNFESGLSLDVEALPKAPAEIYVAFMQSWKRISPQFEIKFDDFQPLGMAFWDSRRLMALELLGPFKQDGFPRGDMFKYFHVFDTWYTWKSISNQKDLR